MASGIGITPFFSVMATRVTEEASYQADKEIYKSLFQESLNSRRGSNSTFAAIRNIVSDLSTKENEEVLRVVWVMRDVSELMFFMNYVNEIVKRQDELDKPAVFVEVYLTGSGNNTNLSFMMTQPMFLLVMASKINRYMKIFFHRPDMDSILSKTDPDKVYFCGGSALKNSLSRLCMKKKVPFHAENFDSGSNLVENALSAINRKLRGTRRAERDILDRQGTVLTFIRALSLEA